METIGLDLHKRESQLCMIGFGGEVTEKRIVTSSERFTAVLRGKSRCRILLERLELRDLTRWTGRQRFRSSPAESAVPQILSPLRQHERVDLQRSGDRLHLHPWLLTQANGRELKLVAVLPYCPWS